MWGAVRRAREVVSLLAMAGIGLGTLAIDLNVGLCSLIVPGVGGQYGPHMVGPFLFRLPYQRMMTTSTGGRV